MSNKIKTFHTSGLEIKKYILGLNNGLVSDLTLYAYLTPSLSDYLRLLLLC